MKSVHVNSDGHFYIDTSPPERVQSVLLALPFDYAVSSAQIQAALACEPGAHKFRTEWIRRLVDLGLVSQERSGAATLYRLAPVGRKIQEIAAAVIFFIGALIGRR